MIKCLYSYSNFKQYVLNQNKNDLLDKFVLQQEFLGISQEMNKVLQKFNKYASESAHPTITIFLLKQSLENCSDIMNNITYNYLESAINIYSKL